MDQHWIAPHPFFDGSANKTVYFANDGGVQVAADISTVAQTSGWTNLANNLGISTFYAGAAAPDGSVIIGGTQDNDVLRYTGGSTGSWYQAENGDGGYCAVDYSNPATMYSEFVRLTIEKSTNGGDTWSNSFTGLLDATAGQALFIAPFVMDPINSSTLFAGGYSLWKTTNGAQNWSSARGPRTGLPFCSALAVTPWNSNEVWAGYTGGTLSLSSNGGSTWTIVDDNGSPAPPERWIMDIAASPYFAGEAIVTLAGFNSDNVWITTDYGASWIRITPTGGPVTVR